MVDLKNNIIYFGYGDVGVVGTQCGSMIFRNIKPPQKVGTNIQEGVELGTALEIFEDKMWELRDLFKTVTMENRIVQYKGTTFDFTNYNEDSVNVCIKHGWKTVCLLALAC